MGHNVDWVSELPNVLWAIRTTPSRATGETPFFLVYGAEAVLPHEITLKSTRVGFYNPALQATERENDLNVIEERRNKAYIRAAAYQQDLRRYHSMKVKERKLEVGDLVLRVKQSTAGMHKLSPKWEGPFTIIANPRPGAYKLSKDGKVLPNSWSIDQLAKFYV